MTVVAPRASPEPLDRAAIFEEDTGSRPARGLLGFLTTTDHKRIGIAYMVTAYAFFLVGGALAELIRAELWAPGTQVVGEGRYNELFTMHGSIMLFLFLGPFAFGLANYFVPLQIGARDMAFPRLNALSYWFYLFGGLTMLAGFLTSDGPADFGWTGYTPLSSVVRSPSPGADLWLLAIVLTGLSGVLTGVNIVATVISMRAPGMTMFRMPIFTWNMLVTSLLVLIAFPVLTSAGAMLFADRHLGAHIFDHANGGVPVLWQHLFWFFGHPEVYILVLPYFGVVTEILPVFSRRPVFGYAGLVFATISIAALSVGVWAHHMFATGAVLLPFFTGFSMLIAVPTGVKIFNWIGTMWGGRITFDTALLFCVGFIGTFVLGGVTGVMLAAAPIDFHVTDSYFVVAHMHYVLFGGSVFALYGGIYYWFPKVTGRLLHEGLGKLHFWLTLVGFHLTFFVQHILGLEGMPRRVADYRASDGFTTLNRVSTIGAAILGLSTFPFLWNVWRTLKQGRGAIAGDNPWEGHTLEWATASPPSPHNFDGELPPIRSNRPLWDQMHPEHTSRGH
ncbi:MAG: cytochrome c oxidase subunit [Acidimicrobiales bacterium]|nr:cytochrome c oxidase subunit [Acidimicrobiales bacterium]